MMKDQRPPSLNSQTLKVLVKPAGPHHRDKRSGSLIAAKTCYAVAGISRDVLNVVIGFFVSAVFNVKKESLDPVPRHNSKRTEVNSESNAMTMADWHFTSAVATT